MKKKLLSMVLALTVAALTVTGCGATEQEPAASGSSVVESSTESPAATTAPENGGDVSDNNNGETTPAETPAPVEDALDLLEVKQIKYYSSYSDQVREKYGAVTVEDYSFELTAAAAAKYPKLDKTLKEHKQTVNERMKTIMNELRTSYEEEADYAFYDSLEDDSAATILRADSQVFSWQDNYYGYAGGAHGYYSVAGFAFDVETGERIALADVVKDEAAFKKYVADTLDETYGDIFFSDVHDSINDYPMENFTWIMDYYGIEVCFNPYELASYADGIQSVTITYSENGDLLNEKYKKAPEKYVRCMTDEQSFRVDIDGDGKTDTVSYCSEYLNYEDYGYDSLAVFYVNDKRIESHIEDFGNEAYLVNNGGKYYFYVFHSQENDYGVLEIYDIAKGKFVGDDYDYAGLWLIGEGESSDDEETGIYTYTNIQPLFNDPDCFELGTNLNLLSTYSGLKTYHVGEDGAPVTDDTEYRINTYFILKTLKDVPCATVDESGKVVNASASLGQDQFVKIMRCSDNWVDVAVVTNYVVDPEDEWFYPTGDQKLNVDTGVYYRFNCDNDYSYIGEIDGEDIWNYFYGMMFAG